MKLVTCVLILAGLIHAQTAVYPANVVTDEQLKVQVNGIQTVLTAPLTIAGTLASVNSCAHIGANMFATIDQEILAISACTGTSMTIDTASPGCSSGRACDGTVATQHSSRAPVQLFIVAWHHNAARKEIEAIEATLGANLSNVPGATGGTIAPCSASGTYVAGSTCYPTIASALSAAGATGWVLIPPSYSATDTYTSSGKNTTDLRQEAFEAYQIFGCSHNITGFPLGNDCNLVADGPADLILQHNVLGNAISTISGSFSPGTQNITVACTIPATYVAYSACQFSAGAGVYVDFGNANQEVAILNSITPPHTLNVTFVRSHSGTIDVLQSGSTAFAGETGILFTPLCPPNDSQAPNCPTLIGSGNGLIMALPNNPSATFPLNAIQMGGPITGTVISGANGPRPLPYYTIIQNADPSYLILFKNSTGTNMDEISDTATSLGLNGTVSVGSFTFNPATCSGTCTINPFFGISSTVGLGTLTTGSGTATNLTMTGVGAATHCTFAPTNAAAATMMYTAPGIYISNVTSNTVSFTHGSGLAGAIFSVSCGSF